MHLKKDNNLFIVDLNSSFIPLPQLKELALYLKNQHIHWYTEATVQPLLEDYEQNPEMSLLQMMSPKDGKGGCYSLLYGADDLVIPKVKGSVNKEIMILEKATKIFRDLCIPLNLSVVAGLDHHTYPDTFIQIAYMLENLKPPYSFIHIATPYPGTPWGDQLHREQRMHHEQSISFNHRQVVYDPKGMTASELQQGYYWLLRTLYSPEKIAKTLRYNFSGTLIKSNIPLEIIQTGILWGTETLLSVMELDAQGYLDKKIQNELDRQYHIYKNQNT
jgi:hypothetical protein